MLSILVPLYLFSPQQCQRVGIVLILQVETLQLIEAQKLSQDHTINTWKVAGSTSPDFLSKRTHWAIFWNPVGTCDSVFWSFLFVVFLNLLLKFVFSYSILKYLKDCQGEEKSGWTCTFQRREMGLAWRYSKQSDCAST